MRTIFIASLALLCLFVSCDPDRLTRCQGGDCENNLLENRVIEIVVDSTGEDEPFIRIVSGDSLVFSHEFIQDDNKDIADDEYKDFVYFQVDPTWDSFAYEDADLAQIKATFEYACFCVGPFIYPIRKGRISGDKTGGKWKVEIDIEAGEGENVFSKAVRLTFD